MINKENYAAFFLDYLEGNLKPEQVDALLEFLDAHPHLKEEMEGLQNMMLQPQEVIYSKKEELLALAQTLSEEEELLLAAAAEGDLSGDTLNMLDERLKKNPSLQRSYEHIKQARLLPDANETYLHKQTLYRENKLRFLPVYSLLAAAAVVCILWLIPGTEWQLQKNSSGITTAYKVTKSKKTLLMPDDKESETTPKKSFRSVKKTFQERKKTGIMISFPSLLGMQPVQELLLPENHSVDFQPLAVAEAAPEFSEKPLLEEPLVAAAGNREFLSPMEWVSQRIKQTAASAITAEEPEETAQSTSLQSTDVMGYLLHQLNHLSGAHASLITGTGKNGKTIALGLRADNFSFTRKK